MRVAPAHARPIRAASAARSVAGAAGGATHAAAPAAALLSARFDPSWNGGGIDAIGTSERYGVVAGARTRVEVAVGAGALAAGGRGGALADPPHAAAASAATTTTSAAPARGREGARRGPSAMGRGMSGA